ncbi:hypothetical protein [Psychroserpens sp. SPM9]|uniref:hypothetical protein n=1 Tax=Psychroserpens sp. SPM9 TaxID=2975598 RepID=UPI0021A5F70D|nr:hypothetical protein [Psychroserpens sp. SPM9]MDG5491643.1 hypothetical protein [Psychroserpens sp. SPM9]
MDKLKPKSTKESLKSERTDNKDSNKSILIGSIIATFIASTPFIFYLYEYVPQTETWDMYLFVYKSSFYKDSQVGIWSILMKLVPLLLLFVWFFTCRHWWYHALLVPIAMYSYQIFGAINEDMVFFDEFQLLYLVPLMAIIIPSIYLIRARMFNKINDANKTMQELEEEFTVKPKGVWAQVKQYF